MTKLKSARIKKLNRIGINGILIYEERRNHKYKLVAVVNLANENIDGEKVAADFCDGLPADGVTFVKELILPLDYKIKTCAKNPFHSWISTLPFCPYCNLSDEARIYFSRQDE